MRKTTGEEYTGQSGANLNDLVGDATGDSSAAIKAQYRAVIDEFFCWKYGTSAYKRRSYAFTDAMRLAIKPEEIANYFTYRAFDTEKIDENSRPTKHTSNTLEYWKKAISGGVIPCWRDVQWNPRMEEGNPTKSSIVNAVINSVKIHETRGEGKEPEEKREFSIHEFLELLALNRNDPCLTDAAIEDRRSKHVTGMFMTAALWNLQWQIIGRVDDMVKLSTSEIGVSPHHQFVLTVSMRWSKNIRRRKQISPQIVLGSMEHVLCPLLSLALYAAVLLADETYAGMVTETGRPRERRVFQVNGKQTLSTSVVSSRLKKCVGMCNISS